MISWLKGKILQKWHLSAKKGVVLDVSGVGYEIQILSKQISTIDNPIVQQFWIHQINREDHTSLYGFKDIKQRDLFRKIISVNGIGPQIGMSLLDDLEVQQFVNAIDKNDIKLLTKSQGIGKRIAERLVVDLKNKLEQYKDSKEGTIDNQESNKSNQFSKYLDEIKTVLNSLGYMDNEIKDSIELISTKEKENSILINSLSVDEKTELLDKDLKNILIRLSQKNT